MSGDSIAARRAAPGVALQSAPTRVLPGRGARADLVLVGGGHAHVQVLRRWMMHPLSDVRVSVVLDRSVAVYSGMVPGFVAGDYSAGEFEIDLVPLARRAGARVILSPATRIDPARRQIEFAGRPPLVYDVASLDVGSSVRGLDLPGVREHALATRPIADLVEKIDALAAHRGPTSSAASGAALRLVVVGAGAAGMELAFTLDARLRREGRVPTITVLAASQQIMPGYPAAVARGVRREAERRDIRLRTGVRVQRVDERAVLLEGERRDGVVLEGERLECDEVVWATGAAPIPLMAASSLPLDPEGFVRVRDSLEVVDCDGLFAVGDCAAFDANPWVPKAGVYAVRQGPVLDANLRTALAETLDSPDRGTRRYRSYRPQRDFLTLINLGAGRALGAKWGVVASGARVWQLKDWIDRRFMRRFQVLAEDGALASEFPTPESMGMEEMPCGGCAAKVGASVLERALARLAPSADDPSVLLGLARPDDAAALKLPGGDVVLATIDAFRSFTDDPWLVGRVAAVNAVSDVLAKGGRPRHALALVTVPDETPAREEETLFQVLAGVRAALDPLGVSLVGGHTTAGEELFVGLTITGELPEGATLLRLSGARPGDALLLSRPLGTGVLFAADMQGRAKGVWVRAALEGMLRSNAEAAQVAAAHHASACTDVSGFGLAGHLSELLRASEVSARLEIAAIPRLAGAVELLARGVRSHYHEQNAAGRRGIDSGACQERAAVELLFDPQTSGGLLFAVPAEHAVPARDALRATGDSAAAIIGVVRPLRRDAVSIEVVEGAPVGAISESLGEGGG